jgi:hypothetical protein
MQLMRGPRLIARGQTGYYRLEDLEFDPLFADPENPEAVRFCWNNTGNEDAKHYAETICDVDSALLTASATKRTVIVNCFEGDTDFNQFDNLAFQPKTATCTWLRTTRTVTSLPACPTVRTAISRPTAA